MIENGALPKNGENSTNVPATGPTPESTSPQPSTKTPEPIKKGESKILEPKYDKMCTCDYEKCPITKKQILYGMHCVFYNKKTYHALCAKNLSIVFKIQQPPRRAKEAST